MWKSAAGAILLVSLAMASPPVFGRMYYAMNGPDTLDIGNKGSPYIVDWNGDGLFDLVVAIYCEKSGIDQGAIKLFTNQGLPGMPYFNGWEFLRADGDYLNVIWS